MSKQESVKFSGEVNIEGDAAYDPDQDPEKKREVRRGYRDLNRDTEGNANPNDFTAEQLMAKVKRADQLFDQVKGPQEATLDSAFLLMASNMGAIKARALKSGASAFDVDDFVAKLVSFMGGRDEALREAGAGDDSDASDYDDEGGDASLDWDKIGRKALAKSRRVPVLDFMLGPLSVEQKKRAQTKRAKLEKNAAEQAKPQELQEEDIQRSENETTKNVAVLEKLLEQHGDPVNLFRFFINPDDFGQSVENLFYLSFLVREGKCALDISEETAEPTVFLCEAPNQADWDAQLKKQQIVMEFDMDTWRHAIEIYNIRKPMVPTRPPPTMRIGNQWY